MENDNLQRKVSDSIEISLRLIFLYLLVSWCLMLLFPFMIPVIWGIIIAVVLSPAYLFLNKLTGNRSALSATILTVLLLAVVLIPSSLVLLNIKSDIKQLGHVLGSESFSIPAPDSTLNDIPVVGKKAYSAWDDAYKNPERFLEKYGDQIRKVGATILNAAVSITGDLVKMLFAIIIAGVLLATTGTKQFTHRFFNKLVGKNGEEFTSLVEKTIRSVMKGIFGVAIIQSSLMGIIFTLARIPYAGVLFGLCIVISIMQLPTAIISIGVIAYLFTGSGMDTTMAIVWSVLLLVASLSDNVLKPILLGKGSPVPMLVIFLGSMGGFILSGFLGLFTGSIILSIGYKLFIAWIGNAEKA